MLASNHYADCEGVLRELPAGVDVQGYLAWRPRQHAAALA